MKKKYYIYIIIVLLISLVGAIYLFTPKGNTLESREKILQNSKTSKYVWEIDKEIKLYDYIISSVYGTTKDGLAVFKSTGNGKYKLQSVGYNEKGKVVIEQIIHQEKVFYIAWCNQSNLDYAEVVYTIDNEELEPRIFDVKENSFISFQSPSDDFSMRITYYDKDGNHYD